MNNNITYIYCLIDPITNEVRYVGKSNEPTKRFHKHIYEGKKLSGRTHKASWISSLLNKNLEPIMEIIGEVVKDEWEFWESYWISQMGQWGFKLTNNTSGGVSSKFLSTTTKRKISEAKKGKNSKFKGKTYQEIYGLDRSEEIKEKRSNTLKGHKVTLETRKKLSDINKGNKLSLETRKKISKVKKGNKLSLETRKKISDALKGKRITTYKVVKPDGNIIILNGWKELKKFFKVVGSKLVTKLRPNVKKFITCGEEKGYLLIEKIKPNLNKQGENTQFDGKEEN